MIFPTLMRYFHSVCAVTISLLIKLESLKQSKENRELQINSIKVEKNMVDKMVMNLNSEEKLLKNKIKDMFIYHKNDVL